MYYFSISLVIIANVLYTLFQDIIPNEVNPAVAVCCMNIAALLCSLPFYFKNRRKNRTVDKSMGKRAVLFGITGIVIDLGFFLAFKSGWTIGYFNIITNITILIVLTVIGTLFFKEKLSLINILGIIVGVIGLSILNM